MNAPDTSDLARITALSELSDRVMRAIAPKVDLLDEVEERRTLLDFLTAMEQQGYTIATPYRATPTTQLGFDEWRIQITRPDRIQFELAYFLRAEPIPPKRKP